MPALSDEQLERIRDYAMKSFDDARKSETVLRGLATSTEQHLASIRALEAGSLAVQCDQILASRGLKPE